MDARDHQRSRNCVYPLAQSAYDADGPVQAEETRLRSWRVEDIDFGLIDQERAARDEDLVVLLCSASFVESGSALYTTSLSTYFKGDGEVEAWLNDSWEHEELQHGRALRAYVAHAWPDFDWERAFAGFFAEYAPTCKAEEMEKTRALEMAARCVVEMGTTVLYRAVSDCCTEPVLKQLLERIRADEVRHYKHFYQYFRKYNEVEGNGRLTVLAALLRRLSGIKSEDADIALRHVYAHRYPEHASDTALFKQMRNRVNHLVESNLSADMCVKMLSKPLDLPARWQPAIQSLLKVILQRLFFHRGPRREPHPSWPHEGG